MQVSTRARLAYIVLLSSIINLGVAFANAVNYRSLSSILMMLFLIGALVTSATFVARDPYVKRVGLSKFKLISSVSWLGALGFVLLTGALTGLIELVQMWLGGSYPLTDMLRQPLFWLDIVVLVSALLLVLTDRGPARPSNVDEHQ